MDTLRPGRLRVVSHLYRLNTDSDSPFCCAYGNYRMVREQVAPMFPHYALWDLSISTGVRYACVALDDCIMWMLEILYGY